MSLAEHPIPLRPHHGMCLAYFQGYGYSTGFVAHMGALREQLERTNAPIRLTVATDNACSACPNNAHGTCLTADKVADFDTQVLTLCELNEGDVLPFRTFVQAVQAHILAPGKRSDICGDCQWNDICANAQSRWAGL